MIEQQCADMAPEWVDLELPPAAREFLGETWDALKPLLAITAGNVLQLEVT